MIFGKKSYTPLRDDRDVVMESSICTGEKTIGFKNPKTGKTERAVAVRCEADIDEFYRRNRLIRNKKFKI